jgi:uncharacterized OB-fold protein
MTDDGFYWEGLAARELRLRICDACGRAACPPRPGCPYCGDPRGSIRATSGEGRLYSWTICHVAFDPTLEGEAPYVVGLVDLPKGARIVARIEGVARGALCEGLPLRVDWREVARPDSDTAGGEDELRRARLVFVPAGSCDGEGGFHG